MSGRNRAIVAALFLLGVLALVVLVAFAATHRAASGQISRNGQ